MALRMVLSLGVCAAALSLGHAALAEEAAKAEAPNTVAGVVVTGSTESTQLQVVESGALGAKSLLDTPYSITVITADDIEKRQATSIGQVFINDPAVYSSAPAATVNWWGTQIRGLGVRNYYVDNVPLLLYWGGDFPLEGVESVQALKGLTGFMYGFGAPGGVIAYKSKRPTDTPLLSTELGYRNDSVLRAHVDAGGRIGPEGRLGYRANLAAEGGEAYNGAGVERLAGSLALDYEITPDLQWRASATSETSNLKHEPLQFYWSDYAGARPPRVTYDYDNLEIDNSDYRADTLALSTGLNWAFAEGWNADLTYGYTRKKHRSNKMFAYLLNEAGDYEGYAYNFAETDENNFVQLMVEGGFVTGSVRHAVVAGASYQNSLADFGGPTSYWSNDFNGNIYQRQPFRVTRQIDYSTDGSPYEERQTAWFLSDTLYLGEQWQAIVGVRQTRYELVDLDGDPATDSGYETTATTPTVALIYKPAPYAAFYGSYAESLEGGSRVAERYANAGEMFGATVSKQYEVGAKYEHELLSLTAAAFRIERAATIEEEVGGLLYLRQDGLTRYDGLEFSGAYQLTADLRLGAGVLLLDPKIKDVSAGQEDLEGNVPDGATRRQYVLNADYRVPAVEGLSLHGTVRYFGDMPTSDANVLFLPERTIVNVGFRYDTEISGQRVSFTGNVNNLLNEKYWDLTNVGEGVNGALAIKVYW
ncbi:TonB-dependent siderophore receptor [Phenylobacterium sp.]|uniref:TonB-dependent siderophore receptor n=1 Tax=Phenylobacterium sp. TaxID=1871053 RepID=UPI00289C8B93|nr:TonB-dependent siderophore receptor [Phenylobacterium sp.]